MAVAHQILETCDRCQFVQTISYEDASDLVDHKTTLIPLIVGHSHKYEVCRRCFDAALEFVSGVPQNDGLAKAGE